MLFRSQDGDINDSHPGYTSGVELDILTHSTGDLQNILDDQVYVHLVELAHILLRS